VRTVALWACFVFATSILARVGQASLGAHQIAFQLFAFLALVLDAIAIAGQVIVGRALGASDADGARAAARRMLEWALGAGVLIGAVLLALIDVLPRAFTGDPAVLERAHTMWPLFCLLWPPAAIVFALDGILIGAGDTRYLAWAMVASAAVYAPLALAALELGWGVVGVWCALLVLMGMRLATLAVRFAGGRWRWSGRRRSARRVPLDASDRRGAGGLRGERDEGPVPLLDRCSACAVRRRHDDQKRPSGTRRALRRRPTSAQRPPANRTASVASRMPISTSSAHQTPTTPQPSSSAASARGAYTAAEATIAHAR